MRQTIEFFFAMVAFLATPALLSGQSTGMLFYEILESKCQNCHNSSIANANLDLLGSGDTRSERYENVIESLFMGIPNDERAAQNGYRLIYPGRTEMSYLFRRIQAGFEPSIDPQTWETESPHPPLGEPLSDYEKELIRQWILYGAPRDGEWVDPQVFRQYYEEGGQDSFSERPKAPLPPEGMQIKMGPYFIEPGGELEFFQKFELFIDEDVDVHRIDIKISNYSHHFILYNFTNEASDIEAGLRTTQDHSDIALVTGVQEATDLRLPTGTAFRWSRDLVLDLNSHYINYSLTLPYKAEVYLNVYTEPAGTARQQMFSLLVPNTEIYIPNDGDPVSYSQPLHLAGGQLYIWALMGHTHKYGRDYKVYKRTATGGKGEVIYDASCPGGIPGCFSPYFDYRHIPMRFFSEFLPVDIGLGIIHEATWVNDGPVPVAWGPTSKDEMMVLGVMYVFDTSGLTTALEEPLPELPVRVTPNPANDKIVLDLAEYQGNIVVQIWDMKGVCHYQGRLSGPEAQVDTSQLPGGIYILEGESTDGRYFHKKFVVSH